MCIYYAISGIDPQALRSTGLGAIGYPVIVSLSAHIRHHDPGERFLKGGRGDVTPCCHKKTVRRRLPALVADVDDHGYAALHRGCATSRGQICPRLVKIVRSAP